ncbi:hypothetical protein DPMN_112183 [Dreissena polymorpha]|uniref:Uncharacterized protein n=1 Tax=Dreissena polymorpha TaxID=45954 RepID=A0A9D4KGI3_DREPO|nr:hypothetical protein DPMN_112150 [Dreissena polymorpha]KAH3838768.1 hypothetical protein DPMN_112183 [Dreissena polymorpha]
MTRQCVFWYLKIYLHDAIARHCNVRVGRENYPTVTERGYKGHEVSRWAVRGTKHPLWGAVVECEERRTDLDPFTIAHQRSTVRLADNHL